MFNTKNTTGIVHCQKDFSAIPDDYSGRIEVTKTTESIIKDIIVSKDCDGKVRTSKLKVIRELDKSEY